MNTLTILHDITAILLPVGVAGAVVAVLSALLSPVAFAGRAAELGGFAVTGWIAGTLLSVTAGYANDWTPAVVSLAAGAVVAAGAATLSALRQKEAIPAGSVPRRQAG